MRLRSVTIAWGCLWLVLVAPFAAAQVLVEPLAAQGSGDPGSVLAFQIEWSNPTDREYFVAAAATGDLADRVTFDPDRQSLLPRTVQVVNVSIAIPASALPGPRATILHFEFVDTVSAMTFEREVPLALQVNAVAAYLGLFPGVLSPPFDRGVGLFVAEVVTWVALAAAISGVGGIVARRIASRRASAEGRAMADRVRMPLAWASFALGVTFSWRLLASNAALRALEVGLRVITIILVAVLVYRIVAALLVFYASSAAKFSRREGDHVIVPILEKLAAVGVVGFGIAYSLQAIGIDVSFLLAGGVVLGLVLSLAAQSTLSNLFSGLFILLDRPFREGDEIRLETGEVCRVDHIGLRSARLFHFRHDQVVIVPNNELATKRVTNMSYPDTTYRLHLRVDVGGSTDLRDAIGVLIATAKSIPDVMAGPGREPVVWLKGFVETGVEAELRVYIPSSRHRNPVRTALILAIKDAFDARGIEIPVPQRELWLHEAGAQRRAEAFDDEE